MALVLNSRTAWSSIDNERQEELKVLIDKHIQRLKTFGVQNPEGKQDFVRHDTAVYLLPLHNRPTNGTMVESYNVDEKRVQKLLGSSQSQWFKLRRQSVHREPLRMLPFFLYAIILCFQCMRKPRNGQCTDSKEQAAFTHSVCLMRSKMQHHHR